MADKERSQEPHITGPIDSTDQIGHTRASEVDEERLGQLQAENTPHNVEKQGWSRGKELSRSATFIKANDRYQGQESLRTQQPEFTLAEPQEVESLEQSAFAALIREGGPQTNTPIENAIQAHQNQAELGKKNKVKEQEQQQARGNEYER